MRELLKEICSLNDKIKGLCTKAKLNSEETGFVTEQRRKFIFELISKIDLMK